MVIKLARALGIGTAWVMVGILGCGSDAASSDGNTAGVAGTAGSGGEAGSGEYKVWIDGELRVHRTNVQNRHSDNSMHVRSVQLANYSNNNQTHTWELWYDNFIVYRGEGPVD